MSVPEYSTEALNVLNKFYNADFIVYVEGEDDVAFWETIFEIFSERQVEIRDLGGDEEVQKIAAMISSNEIVAVVARDADFKVLLDQHTVHPNVLHTYGYSIENSMFVDATIHRAVSLLCRTKLITLAHCRDWLTGFVQGTTSITRVAIANKLHNLGLCVFPTSAMRVLADNNANVVDNAKVEAHLLPSLAACTDEILAEVDAEIEGSNRHVGDLLQGHLLSSAVLQYIRGHMKTYRSSSVLSTDALYAVAIQVLATELGKAHPHRTHYAESVAGIEV